MGTNKLFGKIPRMSGITKLDARPQDCPSGLYKDLFSRDIVSLESVQSGKARLANCICADGRFESNSSGSSSIAGVSCANCTGACVLVYWFLCLALLPLRLSSLCSGPHSRSFAVGHYCVRSQATRCEAGTYADKTGQSTCTQCPAGKFQDEEILHHLHI